MNPRKNLAGELEALEARLGPAKGQKYWRSLEELADTPAFQELMALEFPDQADIWPNRLSRRQFLTLMGASFALAGLSGCAVQPAPEGKIVPYVHPPEEITPGRPLFYATAMTVAGIAVGLLVESHLGRPTKIEGNPDHPASRGATDIYHQASILTLYDPDRSKTVKHLGQTRTWEEALSTLRATMQKHRSSRGAKVRLLTEALVSPTLGAQIQEFLKEFPQAKWHQYEPLGRDAAYRGTMQAFGDHVNTYYDFRHADRVLSFDADFLSCGAGHLRNVADFMSRRRVRTTAPDAHQADMNRLYVVEAAVSPTGAKADHRLALRAGEIAPLARALAHRLGIAAAGDGGAVGAGHGRWVEAVARDLEGHRGRCVVLAGDSQPEAVHLLAHALNHRLNDLQRPRPEERTVLHTDSIEARAVDYQASLVELLEDLDTKQVELLLIIGCNPVYTAPADLRVRERFQEVPLRVHMGLYEDETALQCHWHLPEAHYLEAWSDTRTFDGTATIVQPLIAPLYKGRSAHELLSVLTHQLRTPGYEIVRDYWRKHWQGRGEKAASFEEFWQTAVHDGVVKGTALPTRNAELHSGWERHLQAQGGAAAQSESVSGTYEIVFQPDPTIYDGRFANNGWLQELPKPLTKITWDNVALMSPKTARELGVSIGSYAHGGERGGYHPDVVELRLGDRMVKAPVWIMPGHADGSITVSLGYGRQSAGKVGGDRDTPVGFNAYLLRTSDHLWFRPGLEVRKTGEHVLVACTQSHQLMENRDPVRAATLTEYHDRPTFASEKDKQLVREQTQAGARQPLTLYDSWPYPDHKWGMVIDLTTCTGCKACVVACQAENNIPVVGKEQVAFGREMHWLRIDRYISGTEDQPGEFHFQPVPCMHCERAPCEYVCPVAATVHSAEGINEMLYQRCVGTRFCSNNCPYKVRRFNFLAYADFGSDSRAQQYNPDVTVRSRGVMEKCSYCIQRIRTAVIDAQTERRRITDGEVLTACQAACPAQAIVFGDLNDPKSTVTRWKESPLHYGLLTELNTKPRTTYLAALRNPNPELES
jgi:molybdopterin-containing oxidoreductase family iron-sulfur binding subunit